MDYSEEVVLVITDQNAIDHPRLCSCTVYAELLSNADKRLMIGATLEYIAHTIERRKYKLVRVISQDHNTSFKVEQRP